MIRSRDSSSTGRSAAVNDRHLTIKAIEMALQRRFPAIGLLHHSDQECTCASADDQGVLEAHRIMSRCGNCYDTPWKS